MDEPNRMRARDCLTGPMRLAAFALLFVFFAATAFANEIRVDNAQLQPADGGGYSLSADFDLDLSDRLDRALSQGVPLYFNIDFECYRPRWYWFNETVTKKTYQLRLSFHALTRTYRLSTGGLHQSFASMQDAVRALGTMRDWHVIDADDLAPHTTYEARVRMALDIDRLPKPFQVSALTNPDWTLTSGWLRWGFATGADGSIAQ